MTQKTSTAPIAHERLAEAGVWIARLHGESRDAQIEAGFREWLATHAENARAFELATEVWEDARALRRIVPLAPAERAPRVMRRPFVWGLAAAAMGLVAIGVTWFMLTAGVATGIGEQRLLTLEDGTRVFLNTQTRVLVSYDRQARRIELKHGEALFDVAKRPDWPFIVTAGGQQVRALGTSFVVRRETGKLAVTLVEGKVSVAPVNDRDGSTAVIAEPDDHVESAPLLGRPPVASSARAVSYILTAGERMTITTDDGVRLDRPSIESTMAWRRGQVVLDDTPLTDAASEMNRYNARQIVIETQEASALLVNGLFQAGDSMSFANAVAQTHGLSVVDEGDRILIAGKPAH